MTISESFALEHDILPSLHLRWQSKPSNHSCSNTNNNQESKPTLEIPFSFAFSPYHQRRHHSLHLLHPKCDLHLVLPTPTPTPTLHLETQPEFFRASNWAIAITLWYT